MTPSEAVFNCHLNYALPRAILIYSTKYGSNLYRENIKPAVVEGIMSIFTHEETEDRRYFVEMIQTIVNEPEIPSGVSRRTIVAEFIQNGMGEELSIDLVKVILDDKDTEIAQLTAELFRMEARLTAARDERDALSATIANIRESLQGILK